MMLSERSLRALLSLLLIVSLLAILPLASASADAQAGTTADSDWAQLQAQIDAAAAQEGGGTVTLQKDIATVEGDSTLTVPAGSPVKLDLNGHTLTAGDFDAIEVEPGTNLTIEDGSENHAGKITISETGAANGRKGVYIEDAPYYYVESTVNMTGGSITGNIALGTNSWGGGVYLEPGDDGSEHDISGSFTMTGGAITDNTIAGGEGAGVYGGGSAYIPYNIRISGDASISGNTVGGAITDGTLTGGTASNLHLTGGRIISISGLLTGTRSIPRPFLIVAISGATSRHLAIIAATPRNNIPDLVAGR